MPRVARPLRRGRRTCGGERGVEHRLVEIRVVERSTALRPVEHAGEVGEREVARDPRHEGIEALGDRPRLGEEGAELHLANLHGDPEAP